jgi:hypothetical protein
MGDNSHFVFGQEFPEMVCYVDATASPFVVIVQGKIFSHSRRKTSQ